jgi:site-specific DNA-methyltransferase (adenine-specific)
MSQRLDWQTPTAVYEALDAEFGFTHDPCPVVSDDTFWRVDGFSDAWGKVNFCNPPYGREIGKWVAKAWQESRRGCTCVLLIPSRTDTRWWHEYVMQANEIRFVRGRLKFGNATKAAPFPSAIVVFRGCAALDGEA